MPGIGAPGSDGGGAGVVEACVVLDSLAKLRYFDVEGPGRIRKAVAAKAAEKPYSRNLQADVARELGIDLLVLPDVTDYRFTKEWKSASWYIGSNTWTETTCWVAVNLRFVQPDSGRLIYSGSGQARSKSGYGPAMNQATAAALEELTRFLADRRTATNKEPQQ